MSAGRARGVHPSCQQRGFTARWSSHAELPGPVIHPGVNLCAGAIYRDRDAEAVRVAVDGIRELLNRFSRWTEDYSL